MAADISGMLCPARQQQERVVGDEPDANGGGEEGRESGTTTSKRGKMGTRTGTYVATVAGGCALAHHAAAECGQRHVQGPSPLYECRYRVHAGTCLAALNRVGGRVRVQGRYRPLAGEEVNLFGHKKHIATCQADCTGRRAEWVVATPPYG